jgi:GrpB-like predicted nucleotidyltransferase (UPF0157 family)
VAPVSIVAPRASWPAEFHAAGVRLRDALGTLALQIHHVGSTSVPALPAKDILDIQVTVAALNEVELAPPLTRAGFVLSSHNRSDHRPAGETGPPSEWQKLFVREASGRPMNIHVRVTGRRNQRYALLCRDFLRSHPAAAQAYGLFKHRLAAVGIESGVYAEIKDPVFDLIMEAAEAWAPAVRWTPGVSDA